MGRRARVGDAAREKAELGGPRLELSGQGHGVAAGIPIGGSVGARGLRLPGDQSGAATGDSFAFPAQIVKRVQEEEATVFPGVPTVYATLLSMRRSMEFELPSVRRVTNTAAALPSTFHGELARESARTRSSSLCTG